jgi:CheY-like chemotaxis protein
MGTFDDRRAGMDTLTSARPLKVLVVDDNADAAVTLAECLRAVGHEVGVAWNGEDALEAARDDPPDVVLLDLGMPWMNGYETAHRFRADPALRSAVLVAVTGWGSDDDRRRTREAGFARHLVKPVDPAEVIALLGEHAGDPAASPAG